MSEPEDVVAQVRAALDGPLAAHGFAGGQGGWGDRVEVLFCCPEDDFRAQHPDVLPQPHEPGPYGCVDVTVVATLDGALTSLRVETEDLPVLLDRRGHPAAAAEAAALAGAPLEAALDALPRLLRRALG